MAVKTYGEMFGQKLTIGYLVKRFRRRYENR